MKDYPILMKGPMVVGILGKHKRATRRMRGLDLINTAPDRFVFEGLKQYGGLLHAVFRDAKHKDDKAVAIKSPYGKPGDLLWVREAIWQKFCHTNVADQATGCSDFRRLWCDGHAYIADGGDRPIGMASRPSIHMPKWASRLTLKVTSIQAERLQNISESGAMAEGVVKINNHYLMDPAVLEQPVKYANGTFKQDERFWGNDNPRGAFFTYFEKINGGDLFKKNPWVWVIEFEPHQININDYLNRPEAA